MIGDILHERYELQELLGSGSQGEVYAAWDQKLERRVAIKLLNSSFSADAKHDEAYTRFRREAKLTARFEHPHVVKLHDYDVTPEGKPYLVMEFLDGTTIDQLDPPLTRQELQLLVKQIGYALQNAHENNLVHRDLKPANITFVDRGQPLQRFVLLDLGIAKLFDITAKKTTFVHATSAGAGTPLYMSPEQARGESGDHRSDIYSLGSMLFEFLAGQAPFLHLAHSPMNLFNAIGTATAPRLAEISPGQHYEEELEQLLADCLAKDPDNRPQTVLELVERFEAACRAPVAEPAESTVAAGANNDETRSPIGTSLPGKIKDPTVPPGPKETFRLQDTAARQWRKPRRQNKSLRLPLVSVASVAAVVLFTFFLWPDKPPEESQPVDRKRPALSKGPGQNPAGDGSKTPAVSSQRPPTPPAVEFKLAAIPDREISEGKLVEYQVRLRDADSGKFQAAYELGPGFPEGMVIDAKSGVIRWRPEESQGPGKYPVTVLARAADGDLRDETVFSIVVREVNQAPQLAAVADETFEVGQEKTIQAVATDADLPQNRLQFGLKESPPGMEIDTDSGRITWKAIASQDGQSFPVTVKVSDGIDESERGFMASVNLTKVVTNSIGMKLNLIPAGEFLMGSPENEENRSVDERQHKVRITQPFYMGTYEVTQEEYQKVMEENPSKFSQVPGTATARFPVERVNWFDAVEFCNRLSEREHREPYYLLSAVEREEDHIKSADLKTAGGTGYRLPTEAQWEYACRAGTTTPFHFGNRLNGTEANVDGYYPYGTTSEGPYLGQPTTVGAYEPNAFGLFDMHGNVNEWCQDWYGEDYDTPSPSSDPTGPSVGSLRVLRGGSWYDLSRHIRSANRFRFTPDLRSYYIGFRVVRAVD